MEETNVSIKLLIDTKSHRVLFAEAGKDFIDFLFHILSLPVGTFIPLLKKQGMVGSLGSVYESIESLSTTYLQPNVNKETLLKPKVQISSGGTEVPLLLPNVESSSSSTSMKFYRCQRNYFSSSSSCLDYVTNYNNAICPSCRNVMTREIRFVDPPPSAMNTGSSSSEGGYVKGVVTYMVMDNLEVKPMSTISSITLLSKFDVKEIGALEEKVVELGMDEGVKLLKASLQSKRVLTDVFLPTLKVETEVQ
ncbi:uncharacterized protein LOC142637921 [Castanea sativa]|uniref:uncharacterized protein LOC142637921 n=1 Tax=Castanea sativa TaxID=21020 RepID=UPI003F6520A1